MKKIILPFLLVSLFFVSCVTVPLEQLRQQDIIVLKGMSKKQIFDKSLQWIASTFNSGKSVLEYKDEKSGKIIGNITTTSTVFLNNSIYHSTMTIDIKEGRVRFTLQPTSVTIQDLTRRIYSSEKNMAINSLASIKPSFIKYMKGGSKDSNW